MQVIALRVGGSGTCRGFDAYFERGMIPSSWEGSVLRRQTLNLILEAGRVFTNPAEPDATATFVGDGGERYFLQGIYLRRVDSEGTAISERWPGLILRNRSHPPQFDNIVEVFAPDIEAHLRASKKEWFELDGPFGGIGAPPNE